MTKRGDSLTIKKTIGELAKEFPNKTYIELEKYRDADRNEEAQRIITQQENEELKEDQLTESQQRQAELEPIQRENEELKEDRDELKKVAHDYILTLEKAARDSKVAWEKEHKLRQEAEGELTILKGIETNRVKEYIKKNDALQNELDRTKKENNDLYNKIAKLSERDLQKARESGL